MYSRMGDLASKVTAILGGEEYSPSERDYLQQGDSGEAVKTMQQMLIALGYSVGSTGADGQFGKNTLAGLKAYQKAKGLTVDGLYGPSTQAALVADYKAKQESGSQSTTVYYRVRKTWKDSKTQKGAYKILANAKMCADENPGYKVFDADGNVVYDPTSNKDTGGSNSGASGSGASMKVPFQVKVSIHDLNIRTGAGTGYARTQFIPVGIYTIVEVKSGKDSAKGWGRLKSGAGWIALDHVTVI